MHPSLHRSINYVRKQSVEVSTHCLTFSIHSWSVSSVLVIIATKVALKLWIAKVFFLTNRDIGYICGYVYLDFILIRVTWDDKCKWGQYVVQQTDVFQHFRLPWYSCDGSRWRYTKSVDVCEVDGSYSFFYGEHRINLYLLLQILGIINFQWKYPLISDCYITSSSPGFVSWLCQLSQQLLQTTQHCIPSEQ